LSPAAAPAAGFALRAAHPAPGFALRHRQREQHQPTDQDEAGDELLEHNKDEETPEAGSNECS
jgi:hypothetical protein